MLPPNQERLQIEAPPNKNNMCVFHLTNDHEGSTCLENVRYQQLEVEKVTTSNVIIDEEPSKELGKSISYYLEYESDSDGGNDILLTLEEASCSILTHK